MTGKSEVVNTRHKSPTRIKFLNSVTMETVKHTHIHKRQNPLIANDQSTKQPTNKHLLVMLYKQI
jgi:hypothetical protein